MQIKWNPIFDYNLFNDTCAVLAAGCFLRHFWNQAAFYGELAERSLQEKLFTSFMIICSLYLSN